MADFTQDPIETTDLPTLHGSREIHSRQFVYTTAGGALDIVTDALTPARQAIRVDWMEIDISAGNASYTWTITLEFPAGHEYENHQYLIKTFAGTVAAQHVVLYGGLGGVVVPNGAILRAVASNSVADAVIKIHVLYDIL